MNLFYIESKSKTKKKFFFQGVGEGVKRFFTRNPNLKKKDFLGGGGEGG